ncbi:VOC family protein [Nanchangia anserum]|uniref:VOC family protein n=1 Tax=Nanchangia anserum TaxID=2692125 RepID=A0A8I0GB20_9ACTO|nr:VOC family protein [Nanchangia anserum]MBD3688870.1 VOC family protein [Nanchangia anserum]QOX81138.1 VOC family protein [Nanchangia anserum]
MRIEHVAVYVTDLERARDFFEVFFEGQAGDRYVNQRTGFSSYFISFSDGTRLELMNRADRTLAVREQQVGYHHLAFSCGSKQAVDDKTRELVEAGYRLISGPRTTGDGYYESVIRDSEGNHIEITV